MRSKKKHCRDWKLYVIADPNAAKNRSLRERVRLAIEGGASAVQLRDKKASDAELVLIAKDLLRVTRPMGVPLIINDRMNVAKLSGAEGLHLGQDDGALHEARQVLGEHVIIGRSTHSAEQALRAEAEGFDYIGVGPVFETPTKPDYAPVGLRLVRFAAQNIRIPFVAIGGIDAGNIHEVCQAGARTVAVVRAVIGNGNPKWAAQNLVRHLA